MTERWRKRLGDLDKESPGDDVYERSKGGPQLPEEAIARPSTSSRVVTGVAAFLIFALAISVFAIPALRLREGAGGQPLAGIQPLWPWQTVDEVEDFTNDPSPVGVIGSQEFFDPEGTAWAFGHEVLGWEDPQVVDLMASGGWTTFCDVGTPVSAPSAASGLIDDVGCQNVGVDIPEYAAGYPTATPSSRRPGGSACMDNFCDGPTTAPIAPGSPPSPAPFRRFEVSAPNETCTGSGPCTRPKIIVTVYQPLGPGDGHAWAVLSAANWDRTIDLSVREGSVVREGLPITASVRLPAGVAPSLGLVVGADDCRNSQSGSVVASTLPQPNGVTGVGIRLALPPRPAECSETEPGYVFVSLTEEGVDPGPDPLYEGPSGPLFGFAAVPIVVEWSESAPPDTGTGPPATPPPAVPVEWTTYTDTLGWTIDVPTSWTVEPFEETDPVVRSGARFFSGDLDVGGGPAQDEVLVSLSHFVEGPSESPEDDSTFPLSADDLEPNEGGRQLSFRGDGLPFMLDVRGGSAETLELSAQQDQIVSRMIESIRFEAWDQGTERNGWIAPPGRYPTPGVDDTFAYQAYFLGRGRWMMLVLTKDTGHWAAFGPFETCDQPEEPSGVGDHFVFGCGGVEVGYSAVDGSAVLGNPEPYREDLIQRPVISAWDESLLVSSYR